MGTLLVSNLKQNKILSKEGCIEPDKRTGKFDIVLQKQENLNYIYSFPSLKGI